MKKLVLLLLIILIISPSMYAQKGHLKLLAVKDKGDLYEGAAADLYLEIKKGSGNVFLDTFPLTKVDTQISTRFAKDMACSYLDKDCSGYDFIYTIRADSPIIAGPSAGAAITLLTISLLDDFKLDESIGITGTINSGWIVGPVGGIKEKIDAAKQAGLKKVLIPEGERFVSEGRRIIETVEIGKLNVSVTSDSSSANKTIDLVEYGRKMGLEVVEVSDVDKALYEFTGKKAGNGDYSFDVDKDYNKTMSQLAYALCNRSSRLISEVGDKYAQKQNGTLSSALNLTNRAKSAILNSAYYAAASYCFGANVKLTYILLSASNESRKNMLNNIKIISKNIDGLESSIGRKKKETITDLEAYAVVKERLTDSRYYKDKISAENITDNDLYNIAYSSERVYSAFSWANFFDHRGRKINLNSDMLESSCRAKIAESEERYNYVSLFYPLLDLSGIRKEIDYAYDDMNNKDYELCLFKATQAKAESDIILSVSGIDSDDVINLLDKKLKVSKKNIAKQVIKGNFPILAYSYYEYSDELREKDSYSALLYAEYAIELSNLDMYLKPVKKPFSFKIDTKPLLFLFIGILIGYMLSKALKKKEAHVKKRG